MRGKLVGRQIRRNCERVGTLPTPFHPHPFLSYCTSLKTWGSFRLSDRLPALCVSFHKRRTQVVLALTHGSAKESLLSILVAQRGIDK